MELSALQRVPGEQEEVAAATVVSPRSPVPPRQEQVKPNVRHTNRSINSKPMSGSRPGFYYVKDAIGDARGDLKLSAAGASNTETRPLVTSAAIEPHLKPEAICFGLARSAPTSSPETRGTIYDITAMKRTVLLLNLVF